MQIIDEMREPASLDSIGKYIEFAVKAAKQVGYSEERLSEIERAFREVLTNIVTYAYRERSGDIQVSYTMDRANRIAFKIVDWGVSFNMLLASDQLFKEEYLEQNIPQPSTRFIKRYTDTVEYQRLEDRNYLLATFSPVVRGGK